MTNTNIEVCRNPNGSMEQVVQKNNFIAVMFKLIIK